VLPGFVAQRCARFEPIPEYRKCPSGCT